MFFNLKIKYYKSSAVVYRNGKLSPFKYTVTEDEINMINDITKNRQKALLYLNDTPKEEYKFAWREMCVAVAKGKLILEIEEISK